MLGKCSGGEWGRGREGGRERREGDGAARSKPPGASEAEAAFARPALSRRQLPLLLLPPTAVTKDSFVSATDYGILTESNHSFYR